VNLQFCVKYILPNKMKKKLRLAIADYKRLLVQQEDEIKEFLKSDPGYALREREANLRQATAQIADY
jgi:hypothetical protein